MTPRSAWLERWARARLAAARLALAERRHNEAWLKSAAVCARTALEELFPTAQDKRLLSSKKQSPEDS